MYRFLEVKPAWGGEGWIYTGSDPIGTPLGATVEKRPIDPRYLDNDENRTPDLIFSVDSPADDYLEGVAAEFMYPAGSKLTYVCFRNPRDIQNPNAWKIQLTIEYTDSVLGLTTSILYPWGLYAYNFNPEDVKKYIFQYRF